MKRTNVICGLTTLQSSLLTYWQSVFHRTLPVTFCGARAPTATPAGSAVAAYNITAPSCPSWPSARDPSLLKCTFVSCSNWQLSVFKLPMKVSSHPDSWSFISFFSFLSFYFSPKAAKSELSSCKLLGLKNVYVVLPAETVIGSIWRKTSHVQDQRIRLARQSWPKVKKLNYSHSKGCNSSDTQNQKQDESSAS